MKKQIFGKKLKRDTNERNSLFKSLVNDLVLKETITTTQAKARAIRSLAEKLITKAKVKGQDARFLLQPFLTEEALQKVVNDLSKRFAKRPGGYVRIIKLGSRFGDNAKMVVIEWVDKNKTLATVPNEEETKKVVAKIQKKDGKAKKVVKKA